VESSLGAQTTEYGVIWDWFSYSHEEVDEKYARWVNAEDAPGAHSHIVDRENANVHIVVGISPEHYRNCARCQSKHEGKP
jgi:hypothetical protein